MAGCDHKYSAPELKEPKVEAAKAALAPQSAAMTLPLLFFSRTQSVWFALLSLLLIVPALSCVKRQRAQSLSRDSDKQAASQTKANDQQSTATQTDPTASRQQRININTASAKVLEELPGIGPAMAARIVEHREKYGRFRRPEHLIMVRGLSDKRFRALRDFITIE